MPESKRTGRVGPFELNCPHVGDALTMLRRLPAESIHCCITSPPYFGLRSYLPADAAEKAMELGAEATPDEYVANMVRVFAEVRRVLRPDGTCWLNIGDSYFQSGASGPQGGSGQRASRTFTAAGAGLGQKKHDAGLKPKDLCLIPYRVALALQADGWYLRSNIVWAKGVSFCEHYSGSVMPESVRDRPSSAHEAVFLLTKSDRYFYDADAVREAAIHAGQTVKLGAKSLSVGKAAGAGIKPSGNGLAESVEVGSHRNLRNVWAISPRPYSGSHYAVFPPQIVAPMVKAGCPAKVCAECGAPWVREVERERITAGWAPTCNHAGNTVPGVTLDPFCGSGTTLMVAQELGRQYIGFDLDARNMELVSKRTAQLSLLGGLHDAP